MEIRCVGGPFDNMMVRDMGDTMQAMDVDGWMRAKELPKGHPDLNAPVKYHEYTLNQLNSGESLYIHNESCCKTRPFTHGA